MSKKRSCRRTPEESEIHEKAVRIRKMTDEQIVSYMDDMYKRAHQEGYRSGLSAWSTEKCGKKEASEFIRFLMNNKIQGVGAVTINKIVKVAEENGYI